MMMKPRKFKKVKRKVCYFTVQKIDFIDYKNVALLRRFVSERGKILPRPHHRHQRTLPATARQRHQASARNRSPPLRRRPILSGA